jgi:hypothetical protein
MAPPTLEASLRKYKNEPPSFFNSGAPSSSSSSTNRPRPQIVPKENIQDLKKDYEARLNESMAKYVQKMKELSKNKNTIKII